MSQTVAVLGAYASLPAPGHVQEYYDLLGQDCRVRGLELPYRDALVEDGEAAFLSQLPNHWDRHVVTAIPGTMVRAWADPGFGLASTSPQGRSDALAFVRGVRDAVEALNTAASRRIVACVEVHSAPPGPHGVAHSAEAFGESLSALLNLDWGGASLLVEHCDAWIANDRGEKRMLTLDDEIDRTCA